LASSKTKLLAAFGLQPIGSPARFGIMSESSSRQINPPGGNTTLPDTDARQGKTGMGVRYVLAISLGAAVIVLAILYFAFGFTL